MHQMTWSNTKRNYKKKLKCYEMNSKSKSAKAIAVQVQIKSISCAFLSIPLIVRSISVSTLFKPNSLTILTSISPTPLIPFLSPLQAVMLLWSWLELLSVAANNRPVISQVRNMMGVMDRETYCLMLPLHVIDTSTLALF